MAIAAGQTPLVWGLVAREVWRRARHRLRAGTSWRWRYAGRTPDRVLIAPPDLRIADPQIAAEIYSGRYPLGGYVVESNGASPFELDVDNPAWERALHNFRWLRHMRGAGTELAAANARALVTDWMRTQTLRMTGIAWQPAVTAERIIAWLQHSTIILQGAEFPFYRTFLRSLATQIRFLRVTAASMPDGEDLLRARIALAFAALSLPAHPTAMKQATRQLAQELERQILPDGGHISRNPGVLIELLADLLPLRHTYANQAEEPPPELVSAIERMLPALRFFRHRDGTVARFNGMGATAPDRLSAILRHDDTEGAPLLHAPHSGYERLAVGETTIIADVGHAPPIDASGLAHAGCLSFEMSAGFAHLIVNSGVDDFGPADYRPLARATAAHSTLAVEDTSSCRFHLSAAMNDILGSPIVSGPREVATERTDTQSTQGFVARHDGYAQRFGLLHERQLTLSESGARLDGVDRLYDSGGPARHTGRERIAIRFHLHPSVDVLRDEEGHLLVEAAGGERWLFACAGIDPVVEESIFFASIGGPRRSRQIVLSYRAAEHPEVRWRFLRAGAVTD